MNILIAINNGYYNPAKVMLTSLCINNRFENHSVYLLYSELDSEKIDDLKKALRRYHCEVNPVYVDKDRFEGLPLSHHFSIETYYRFLMQTMVPDTVSRILWLDADMIIKGSLKEFYYQDFEDKCIAVCKSINKDPDSLIKKLCLPAGTPYFNAGTILFNLEKIRKEMDPEVYFEYAKNNPEKITWLDQDILNAVFFDKKKVHDYKLYNFMHFSGTNFSDEEKRIIDNETVVLHYIGSVKPWNPKYVGYTYKYYKKYAKRYNSFFENIRFEKERRKFAAERK